MNIYIYQANGKGDKKAINSASPCVDKVLCSQQEEFEI